MQNCCHLSQKFVIIPINWAEAFFGPYESLEQVQTAVERLIRYQTFVRNELDIIEVLPGGQYKALSRCYECEAQPAGNIVGEEDEARLYCDACLSRGITYEN